MANRFQLPNGSWLLAEDLLEKGDPAFVDELCRISDADRLGEFASSWYSDRRPSSRRLLLLYLERPVKNYRHEALLKRLLKAAESRQDHEVMARLLVAFDRSIRREKRTLHRYDWSSGDYWTEESIVTPHFTAMPRTDAAMKYFSSYANDQHRERSYLFSLATRKYLRRRLWRCFRMLGKRDPRSYVNAIAQALVLYRDSDCTDGLQLLDNWGLVHVLFHHCDVLTNNASGWKVAQGKSLGDLRPAPAFAEAWKADASVLLEILTKTECRPVRQWAIALMREYHSSKLQDLPIELLIQWLGNDDADLANLAAESLRTSSGAARLSMNDWLRILDSANLQALDLICETMVLMTTPASLRLSELVDLACRRPVPVVRLAVGWLRERVATTTQECQEWLRLCDAECDSMRVELAQLARDKVLASPSSRSTDVMEALDSPYPEVRGVGWEWLTTDETTGMEANNWQRLLETPYDDIQLRIADYFHRAGSDREDLAARLSTVRELRPDLIRLLWASVLLNVHRGGRQKPVVIQAIVDRMEKNHHELELLLPILGVALRSVRSTEFRAGILGIVRFVEKHPSWMNVVQQRFPELKLTSSVPGVLGE